MKYRTNYVLICYIQTILVYRFQILIFPGCPEPNKAREECYPVWLAEAAWRVAGCSSHVKLWAVILLGLPIFAGKWRHFNNEIDSFVTRSFIFITTWWLLKQKILILLFRITELNQIKHILWTPSLSLRVRNQAGDWYG